MNPVWVFVAVLFSGGLIGQPSNDDCSGAISAAVILDSCGTNPINASFQGATNSNIGTSCGGTYSFSALVDVWYNFTVPTGRNSVTLKLISTSTNEEIYVDVFDNECSNFQQNYRFCTGALDTTSDILIQGLKADSTYLIRFEGQNLPVGQDFQFCLFSDQNLPAPTNDDCSGAIDLTVNFDNCVITESATNFGTTDSGEGPGCNSSSFFNYEGGDLWYTFTIPSGQSNIIFQLTQFNFGFNSGLAYEIYDGSCGSFGSELVCSSLGFHRSLVTNLVSNNQYYLRIYDYGNNSFGSFELCAFTVSTPTNDSCSGAMPLTVGQDYCYESGVEHTNLNTTDSGEISPCGQASFLTYNGGDLWYTFNATSSDIVLNMHTISIGTTSLVCGLYSGVCGDLTQEVCASYFNSGTDELFSGLTIGQDYFLRIWDHDNNNFGFFEFDLAEANVPPANDLCGIAESLNIGIDSCTASITATTRFATDSGQANTCGNYSGGDIWYTFNLPTDADHLFLQFDDIDEDYYAVLYSGTCPNLNYIECSPEIRDNSSQSRLVRFFNLNDTETYFVRIYQKFNNSYSCFQICPYTDVPEVYVVNTEDDSDDGVCDSGHCSLREAINVSNIDNSYSKIKFDIAGSPPFTIPIGSNPTLPDFPQIEQSIVIDGSTQPNWQKGDIIIDGDQGNAYLNGDAYTTNGVAGDNPFSLFGLHLKNFHSAGVLVGTGAIGAVGKENIFTDNNSGIEITSPAVLFGTGPDIKYNDFGFYANTVAPNDDYSILGGQYAEDASVCNNAFENEDIVFGLDANSGMDLLEFNSNTITSCNVGVYGDFVSSIILANNHFLNCGTGLTSYTSFDILIDSCTFQGINGSAIEIYEGNLVVTNSTFTSNNNAINYEESGVGWYGTIENNVFHSNNVGVAYSSAGYFGGCELIDNIFTCNGLGVSSTAFDDIGSQILPPEVINTTNNIVSGSSVVDPSLYATYEIKVYLVDDSLCPSSTCQGSTLIGSTNADMNTGDWTVTVDSLLQPGMRIATQLHFYGTSVYGAPSNFSCHVVQPDVCETAKVIPVNPDECATTGAVVDMELLTDSGQGIGSSCDVSYAGGDAWFKISSPDSWNSLVRVNINNAINGIAEAYIGSCGNLLLEQCIELDSLPHALILEGYTPDTEVYLRVWDRDNTVVNSGTGALLHFTAHRLDTLQENWEICDLENNLVNGNPTILSERDANTFIIEYEDVATPAEIQEIRDSLILGGGMLIDSCLCGTNPLELWDHATPVEMEINRRGSRGRARVDTSNYNYIFEQIEFQVNAYADGEQYNADVTMDAEGNFVIIWEDLERRNVFMRVYSSSGNPLSKETRVGSQSATQHNAQVEIYDSGDFITAWHEFPVGQYGTQFNIAARLWNADGTPKAFQFNLSSLSSNTSTVDSIKAIAEFGTDVSLSSNGVDDFIATWHSGNFVFFQKFNQSGGLIDTLQQVAPLLINGNNSNPRVSMNASGDFVIVWNGMDDDGKGVYLQRYNSNLTPIGVETLVNTTTALDQSGADVTLSDDGSYIVTWHSYEQEGTGLDYGVYAQRFDSAGNTIGSEFLVNSYTADAQKDPSIAQMNDGKFLIIWSSFDQDGFEEGIYGQFYDNTGTIIDQEFRLNNIVDPEQENPSLATNGESVFIGVWEDGINDGDGKGIFGQRYEIIDAGGQDVYYPIGTATPSTLLGDELTYPGTIYAPTDSLASVRVAIIDTGVDPNHPYLSGAIWNNQQVNGGSACYVNDTLGYDFVNDIPNPIDYDGHGTRVNGIVARDFPQEIQLELMNLKFHEFQKGKVFDAVCAIYYAVDNGADIINMSWGFEASEFPSILQKAIQYASDNDVLLITTAGNTSKDNDNLNKYPANLIIPHMIRVTSYEYTASTDVVKLANYASYGKNNVDIAAYGFVETPTLGDTLSVSSGTSLAAPHITRTAAIIKGLFPSLSATDIKDCILNTAFPESEFSNLVATGGILDHEAAIDCAYEKASDCVAIDLQITVPQPIDTIYRSDAWVEIEAEIDTTANVETWGAHYVEMLPGFETDYGAVYLADIDDCDTLNTPLLMPSTGGNNSVIPQLRISETSSKAGKIKIQMYYPGTGSVKLSLKSLGSAKVNLQPEIILNKEGWYEYILDAKQYESGQIQINYENSVSSEKKTIQIVNDHYEKYINRYKKAE